MIQIGNKPILWHIMKSYSKHGFNEFIICCGYKADVIKEYFANYYLHTSDVTFDFTDDGKMILHNNFSEPWKVTLVDTGLHTMTGGRVKRIQEYVGNEPFMLTYGDGVSDVNVTELLAYHKAHGKMATMTSVNMGQRFGVLEVDDDLTIHSFREKSDDDGNLINAGFMVLNPEIFSYIAGDQTVLEKEPLEAVARVGQLKAFHHEGFWQCMDTQRDKQQLEQLWESGKAPWKTW